MWLPYANYLLTNVQNVLIQNLYICLKQLEVVTSRLCSYC